MLVQGNGILKNTSLAPSNIIHIKDNQSTHSIFFTEKVVSVGLYFINICGMYKDNRSYNVVHVSVSNTTLDKETHYCCTKHVA